MHFFALPSGGAIAASPRVFHGSLSGMDLRLRSLERLDTRAVPIPHGTEVVTRVDRVIGERRVPQGTVGRVTKVDGDAVDVTVIGIGVLRCP